MRGLLLVAAGGAIGASARYLLAKGLAAWDWNHVPWYTLIANITGALLLGIVVALTVERGGRIEESWLLFLGVGVLGGYTTFSTFSLETYELIREGLVAQAAFYSIGSLLLGVIAVWVGFAVARAFVG